MPVRFPILLIDDDAALAEVLDRAARQNFPEASLYHVHSIQQAINYLDNLTGNGPKLILLDIDLQLGVDGFEFLTLLRQHDKGRLLPVVVLSTNESPTVVQEAYALGASAFMHKPFSYDQWKAFATRLRTYWFTTVTIPSIWFEDGLNLE